MFAASSALAAPHGGSAASAMARLPLRFEPNRGQFDERVRFVARRGTEVLFLTDEDAKLVCGSDGLLTMRVAGARKVTPRADQVLVTTTSYFVGNDPTRWRTGVPTYGRVTYPAVLAGVDLVYHGESGQLEYDFVVAPGVDAKQIAFEIDGGKNVSLTRSGDLAVKTAHGAWVQARPRVFQRDTAGREHEVRAGYRIVAEHTIAFALGPYDHARALIIDPVLAYSTYLGGSGDEVVNAGAVDATGNVYVTGNTTSTNFPTKGAAQATNHGSSDGFIAKLDAAGTTLVYATYFGGAGLDNAQGITVDGNGNAYVTGQTTSTDFPTVSPLQAANAGGSSDGFVLKLNAAGNAFTYSTYLGGGSNDVPTSIAVDGTGNVFLSGLTSSTNFPTQNAFMATAPNASLTGFVTKVNAAGSALVYSTYLGGSTLDQPYAIAVDSAGNAYIAGETDSTDFPTKGAFQSVHKAGSDAFVAKLNATGSALVYSTFLGGAGGDSATDLAVDSSGSAYVMGLTSSADFPTQAPFQGLMGGGALDAFVTKLAPAGNTLVYSTYLGGSGDEYSSGIGVDAAGNAVVLGSTASTNFPVAHAIQATNAGGTDMFVAKLAPTGTTLRYATYFGGGGTDTPLAVAVISNGDAYLFGKTNASSFPIKNSYQGALVGATDGVLAKISNPSPVITPASLAVPPLGTQTFTANNGTGTGYVYGFVSSGSGGSIDPTTGAYTAGSIDHTVDTIAVSDSEGAFALAVVQVSSTPIPDAGTFDDGGLSGNDQGNTPTDSGGVDPRKDGGDIAGASSGCSCQLAGANAQVPKSGLLLLGLLLLGAWWRRWRQEVRRS